MDPLDTLDGVHRMHVRAVSYQDIRHEVNDCDPGTRVLVACREGHSGPNRDDWQNPNAPSTTRIF